MIASGGSFRPIWRKASRAGSALSGKLPVAASKKACETERSIAGRTRKSMLATASATAKPIASVPAYLSQKESVGWHFRSSPRLPQPLQGGLGR
ncbi:MAG: hypothetical protein R3D02_08640 [Hyphomicrobiales bacterium]